MVSECRLYSNKDDESHDRKQQLNNTEQEKIGELETDMKIREGELVPEQDLKRTIIQKELYGGMNTETKLAVDQYEDDAATLMNGIRNLKQHYREKLALKCHKYEVFRNTDDDFINITRNFYKSEIQLVLDRIKTIKDRWRALDLQKIVQLVNPRIMMRFDREPCLEQDERLLEIETEIDNKALDGRLHYAASLTN